MSLSTINENEFLYLRGVNSGKVYLWKSSWGRVIQWAADIAAVNHEDQPSKALQRMHDIQQMPPLASLVAMPFHSTALLLLALMAWPPCPTST